MICVVSFETAKRLKRAGFPLPTHATATDILKELGSQYVLWFDEHKKLQKWFCAKTAQTAREAGTPVSHENPAEACALTWLAIHEKIENDGQQI